MKLTLNKRDPIYLQVIQFLKQEIISGQLNPGQEIPSRRQLANDLKINPNTVQRAYSEMEAEQLIYTEPNRPSRVTEDPNILKHLKNEWVNHAVKDFVVAIKTVDISIEEVTDMIKTEMNKQP
ncbi:GntR family transcriptional regulator [Marinilactibacillus sp. Marseille-P9653]|uniref:GntR family transcriptional regulator n=1 Tax=Marinilactibacillus sp. Marseille-P9653 TaxID=2866583 RepID=UPI001CE49A29|nr:GntR family transcriptional regulator [Marinilactibacillus sp. Marseille-P9653]